MKERTRILLICVSALCAAAGIMFSVWYGSAYFRVLSVCDGSLYTVQNGEVFIYDRSQHGMRPISVEQTILSVCAAENGNVWLLASADDAAELLLWDGERVARTIPLDYKPLAVRRFQNGVLLVRRHPWEQMTEYLKQDVPISAVTADVLYLDTDTMRQTKLAECGFPLGSAQCDCFAVCGDKVLFFSPVLLVNDTEVACDERRICLYSAESGLREMVLPETAEIRDICAFSDGFAAVGSSELYAFSAENGMGNLLLSRKELPTGAFSSDGRYYFYAVKGGLSFNKERLYAVRLSDGCTVRLWQTKTTDLDSVSTIYFP